MRRWILLAALAFSWGCTDIPIGIPDEEISHPSVDDELTITGEADFYPFADGFALGYEEHNEEGENEVTTTDFWVETHRPWRRYRVSNRSHTVAPAAFSQVTRSAKVTAALMPSLSRTAGPTE